jgi:hypothetical protein
MSDREVIDAEFEVVDPPTHPPQTGYPPFTVKLARCFGWGVAYLLGYLSFGPLQRLIQGLLVGN